MSKGYKTIKKSDMVIALYYQLKHAEERECDEYECKSGSCVCIDKEQVALVSWLGGEHIMLENKDSQITFLCKSLNKDAFCQKAKKHRYDNRIISYKQRYDSTLKDTLKLFLSESSSASVYSMFQQLPIIRSINLSEKIDERDSICYLCLFSEKRLDFIKLLLKDTLIQSISLHLAGKPIDDLVKGLEHIFCKIMLIYKDYEIQNDFNGIVIGCAEQYDKKFEHGDASMQPCREPLLNCRTNARKQEDMRTYSSVPNYIAESDENEIEEIVRQYSLLIRVLGIINNEVHLDYGNKLFEISNKGKRRIPHNIYDKLDEVLKTIPHKNAENKDAILKALADLLKDGGEESSNNLEEFYHQFISTK